MITDYFDGALYINLDHRADRRSQAEAEFAKYGLVVERVVGIKGNPGLVTPMTPGNVGNILSHRKCILMAQERKWNTVLIFEDDVEFVGDVNALFDDYFSRVPEDWDMVYLGGNHWGERLQFNDSNNRLTYVADNVYRTRYTLTTHAYAIKSTLFVFMDYLFSTALQQVDILCLKAQEHFNVYALRPNLAIQSAGYSDIARKVVDYSFMKK
jgi:GR25 family glycosyltransferase involved in LPS biosynthesis